MSDRLRVRPKCRERVRSRSQDPSLRRTRLAPKGGFRGWTIPLLAVTHFGFGPPSAEAQTQKSLEAPVYLVATSFLSGMNPTSVVDDYYRDPEWMRRYGLAIRCSSTRGPVTALRLIAEDQDVSLADRIPPCVGTDGPRALRFSRVQITSNRAAWFIVSHVCIDGDDEVQALYTIRASLGESGWRLDSAQPLGSGGDWPPLPHASRQGDADNDTSPMRSGAGTT